MGAGLRRTGRPAARHPEAQGGNESVDEWFDSIASVVGLIGRQRDRDTVDAAEAVEAVEPAEPAESAEPAPRVSLAPAPRVSLVKPPRTPSTAPPPPAAQPPAPAPAPAPHVGTRPPTYSPEPTLLPAAPEQLAAVVPDTALDGAQYPGLTLRAASIRGDSARYRGEPRTDALLLTRFGDDPDGLLLAVLGSRARLPATVDPRTAPPAGTGPELDLGAAPASHAVHQAATHLAEAIGRSRTELAADLRTGARDRLRYGLQRLTAGAAAGLRGPAPHTAGALHCLLISLDPQATHRAAFGLGPGGLYLLRSGHWIDAYAARLLHHPDGQDDPAPVPPGPRPFRFRLVPATPGDILLLCSPGLADPVAEEPAVGHFLATHWSHPHPPGTVDFLRQIQVRAKGYADDRTAVALWAD
ncbi:protein phosphatase 2C domain-containing protein [Kitasatospora acidiphila]|uniref:Protein phosphatase 2C domain-containing protein n=1 Tax=Kitasatospora acidiphila TaxID=2567942 RepID=A0A540WC08_9ACTN|nr:protein phosphatase 2C domain-containing protein [Kitasatospora acidiphila]TQF05954.1 protein phosphatase 2C domain-containing protein [Kitasatospora acidiphila]